MNVLKGYLDNLYYHFMCSFYPAKVMSEENAVPGFPGVYVTKARKALIQGDADASQELQSCAQDTQTDTAAGTSAPVEKELLDMPEQILAEICEQEKAIKQLLSSNEMLAEALKEEPNEKVGRM